MILSFCFYTCQPLWTHAYLRGNVTPGSPILTVNQVLEAAVVCAVISRIFGELRHSFTLHSTNITWRTWRNIKRSEWLQKVLSDQSHKAQWLQASGRTYCHFADGGLLQEELEVVDLPGVWGRVRGEDQVRSRRHELQHNSESETGSAAAVQQDLLNMF